jgi:hypothetical protein
MFESFPHFLRVEFSLQGQVQRQFDEHVVVQVWDHLDQLFGNLFLSLVRVGEDVLEVGLVGDGSWWEKVFRKVSLAPAHVRPVVGCLLHTEKLFARVDALEWLSHRELESLFDILMDFVCVASKRHGLLSWELRL